MADDEEIVPGSAPEGAGFSDSILMTVRDERLRQVIAEMEGWAARTWVFEDAPNLVVYSVLDLAFSFPKRANDLIASMRELMKADRLVPAVILARALVETIAMGRYFIETMEKHLANKDFARLERDFLRFYQGSKFESAPIKSIHINDALRDLEARDLDYLSYLMAKYPKQWAAVGPNALDLFKAKASLLKTYDKLSEISHPNGLGTQYLYPANDAPNNNDVVEHYRFMTGAAIWQGHHLLTALTRLQDFAHRFVEVFPDRTRFSDESSSPPGRTDKCTRS